MIGATLCSGIGAPECAAPWIDWRWHAEIEAFPAAVHAVRFPGSVNLGDMTSTDLVERAAAIALPDIIVAGTPCFTAKHLVLSAGGYVPIEDVQVGDLVMTHKGRMRRVVRIGSKLAAVGEVRGVGMREPLTCTADHPFLSVNWRSQNTRRGGSYARIEHAGEPEWIPASEMPGRQWCSLTTFETQGGTPKSAKFTPREAMYLAGMYLGDGHIRGWSSKRKKALVLSLNPAKLEMLAARIAPVSFCVSRERTSVRATICDTALCDWLLDNFGRLSHAKKLPAWVLGHQHRAALLQGYLDSDGSAVRGGVSIATTSRALAYGVADLLNAEGYAASVGLVETPDTCVIEGRTVNQRDWYQVRAFRRDASRKSRVARGYLLRKCASFTPAGCATVFDIEVDEDHSYVVNGAVVHNCQAFSVAGTRGSLADARGNLTLLFVRICNAIDDLRRAAGLAPLWIVWENVPGVFSTADNAFGSFVAGMVGGDAALEPPRGRGWTDAGVVSGPERCAAWRVLDAQHFGLAQRRRRVFVLARGGSGSWAGADALLPVVESVRWHPAPRREAGQRAARPIAAGSAGSSGYRNDADTADNLIAGALRHTDGGSDVDHARSHQIVVGAMPAAGGTARKHGQGGGQQEFEAGYIIPLGLGEDGQLARALNGCKTAAGRHDVSVDTFVAHTLRAAGFDARQSDVVQYGDRAGPLDTDGHSQAIAFSAKDHGADAGEIAPTLRSMGFDGSHANGGGQIAVALHENQRAELSMSDTAGALKSGGGKPGQAYAATLQAAAVRRLTPRECERLQGFPDDWTLIGWRGKPAADGPRYKALGNSMAIPVIRWILDQVRRVQEGK